MVTARNEWMTAAINATLAPVLAQIENNWNMIRCSLNHKARFKAAKVENYLPGKPDKKKGVRVTKQNIQVLKAFV